VDVKLLPADEAAELQTLIERSDVLQTSSQFTPKARDLHVYEITVETVQGAHRLELDEGSMPQSLKPLLNYLTHRARPMPLK
jgi:hypothetical protein